jgi:hypothetical protein
MDREVPSLFYFLFAFRSNQQQVATSPAPLYDYQSLNSEYGWQWPADLFSNADHLFFL